MGLDLGNMKGGKEDEKMKSPMFPRLHVNDTDKGGPRAPPRNKMALYEQLSIPLQRFNSSSLLLPPQSAQNLGPSSSQGNVHEGTVFPPFYASPSTHAYSAEKFNSRSSDGDNMRIANMEFERRSDRRVNFKSANAVKSVAECSSVHQRDTSNTKNSSRKRVDDDDDDFRVPTFVNSENASYLNKDTTGVQKRRLNTLHPNIPQHGCPSSANASVQLAGSCNRPLEQTNASDAKSAQRERNYNEQKLNDGVVIEEQAEKSFSHPEAREKLTEPSRFVKSSSDREHAGSRGICQESCGDGARDGSVAQSESQSKISHSHRYVNVTDNCNQTSGAKENKSTEPKDVDRSDEMSDTSMEDSISGLEISPDDVVGMIGPKQFWKARRAIVKHYVFWRTFIQQRVFAIQVFELHRLIKVQKLLAASPHLLLEENSCFTPQKVPIKNLALEPFAKPQQLLAASQSVKQKDDSQKPNQNFDYETESTGVAPLPAYNDNLNKALSQPPRSGGPYSGNTPPALPPPSDNRSNPWCFQPPAQQWLVPVMSPSEGLIYKPYAGPCPPTAGFVPPVYGNYSPMSLPAGYGVPPHQEQDLGVLSGAPMAPNYLPAMYGHPPMNPMISNSAVQQMSPMTCPMPNLHTEQNSRSSCNMSFPKSDAFTIRHWKVHGSKDSELQGSTASSPCERTQQGRDAFPLFPMPHTAETSVQPSESNSKEHQARVIRVVPHNARSATKSVARIFRSIQQERQQLDE